MRSERTVKKDFWDFLSLSYWGSDEVGEKRWIQVQMVMGESMGVLVMPFFAVGHFCSEVLRWFWCVVSVEGRR